MDYGKAIRIGRAIAGLQQKELAELAGVDPSHISLIEFGKRKPSLDTVEKLAKALQIPDHLLTLLAAEPEDLDLKDPKELAYWSNQIPIGRTGTAEECASAILWLASDEASYCVGTMLVVDGGQASI